jgi:hypothetical protein
MILPGEISCAAAKWQAHLFFDCKLFDGRYVAWDRMDFEYIKMLYILLIYRKI